MKPREVADGLYVETFCPHNQCYGHEFTEAINQMISKYNAEHPEYIETKRIYDTCSATIIACSYPASASLGFAIVFYRKVIASLE